MVESTPAMLVLEYLLGGLEYVDNYFKCPLSFAGISMQNVWFFPITSQWVFLREGNTHLWKTEMKCLYYEKGLLSSLYQNQELPELGFPLFRFISWRC